MPRAPEWTGNPVPDLLGALQGYYATIVLLQLRRIGVLSKLVAPKRPAALAKQLGVDAAMTKQLLDFLSLTTNVVRQTSKGAYQLNEPQYAELSFQLEKFAGAYGPAAEALATTLHEPDKCASYVDRRALATAFAEADAFRSSLVSDLIIASGANCLLDLGCGPASLLVNLAQRNPGFHGIGLDASRSMCTQARRAVHLNRVDRQIDIRQGDAGDPSQCLSRAERTRVDSLHGSSFLNEFFGPGGRGVVKTLRALSRSFPGRRAWFVDYYSAIGQAKVEGGAVGLPLALLQDLAQIVSGQGVPPTNAVTWRRLYRQAGCKLRNEHEFQSTSIRWFIHEVTL